MSVLKLRVICPRPDLRQRTLSHTMSSSFCPSFVSFFCTRTLGGPTWLLLAPNDDQHPDNPNPGNRGAVRAVRRTASPVRFSGRQTSPLLNCTYAFRIGRTNVRQVRSCHRLSQEADCDHRTRVRTRPAAGIVSIDIVLDDTVRNVTDDKVGDHGRI